MADFQEHEAEETVGRGGLDSLKGAQEADPGLAHNAVERMAAAKTPKVLLEDRGRDLHQSVMRPLEQFPPRRLVPLTVSLEKTLDIGRRACAHDKFIRAATSRRLALMNAFSIPVSLKSITYTSAGHDFNQEPENFPK